MPLVLWPVVILLIKNLFVYNMYKHFWAYIWNKFVKKLLCSTSLLEKTVQFLLDNVS